MEAFCSELEIIRSRFEAATGSSALHMGVEPTSISELSEDARRKLLNIELEVGLFDEETGLVPHLLKNAEFAEAFGQVKLLVLRAVSSSRRLRSHYGKDGHIFQAFRDETGCITLEYGFRDNLCGEIQEGWAQKIAHALHFQPVPEVYPALLQPARASFDKSKIAFQRWIGADIDVKVNWGELIFWVPTGFDPKATDAAETRRKNVEMNFDLLSKLMEQVFWPSFQTHCCEQVKNVLVTKVKSIDFAVDPNNTVPKHYDDFLGAFKAKLNKAKQSIRIQTNLKPHHGQTAYWVVEALLAPEQWKKSRFQLRHSTFDNDSSDSDDDYDVDNRSAASVESFQSRSTSITSDYCGACGGTGQIRCISCSGRGISTISNQQCVGCKGMGSRRCYKCK